MIEKTPIKYFIKRYGYNPVWYSDRQFKFYLDEGYKKLVMDYQDKNSSVEDLIQASKDQNGRVYQTLQKQEKRIKHLQSELDILNTTYRNHLCPVVRPFDENISSNDLFNRLWNRLGTKGILKMLAEC